jgi:outer membrane protein assembly factor BamB
MIDTSGESALTSAGCPASLSARVLTTVPGVRAITANHGVRSSDNPCSGSGSCREQHGWVTDRRKKKGEYDIEGTQAAPASFLPDGSFVSVAENGKLLFVSADGQVRTRIDLGVSGFKTAPAIGTDGTIYLAREDKQVYALTSTGTTRWIYSHTEKFLAGVV